MSIHRVHALATAVGGAALLACGGAQAAITCSAASSGVLVAYDSAASTATLATGSVTVNCTRSSLTTDPATTYWAIGIDGGLSPSGTMSRARYGGTSTTTTIDYSVWRDAARTLTWSDLTGSGGTRISGQVNFGSGATGSTTASYYLSVPPVASQSMTLQGGSYSDTQTMRLYVNSQNASQVLKDTVPTATSTFGVQVNVQPVCALSSPPGNLSFSYTSFQATAAQASTSLAVRCATGTPYTLSLDASTGSLLGLSYSLALSATSGTGNGSAQAYSISGSIAAGQSGTCSAGPCGASAVRTLTLAY